MRKCPIDDFTLATETYEGVTIDRCPHCRGVWLDAGELETIQETQDVNFRDVPESEATKAAAAIEMAKAKSEGPSACVICQDEMEKREYGFASQVMVDTCPKGHGVWLDQHELSRLESFFEDEQAFAYQAEAEILRELKGKGLGAILSGLLHRFKP